MIDTIQGRLRKLADWFDVYDDRRGFEGDREVQNDLRADADEIDRLRAELSRVRGERDALRIRLQGYAGEVQRAMLRVTKTIEYEVSDE